MNKKPYRNILSTTHKALAAEIRQARSSIPHAGETGALIENLIRAKLQEVLPEKVAVGNGFVVDAEGGVSKQMDIILYDRLNTPRIFYSDDAQMFPVEATYACGEIKTNLNTETLRDTFEKCSSYKALVRKAYINRNSPIEQTFLLYGDECKHWQSIFFCIAVESIRRETLLKTFVEIVKKRELKYNDRVDTVCSLDGKFLLNATKPSIDNDLQGRSIDLLPDKELNHISSYQTKEPWALFVFLLMRYMVQAPQVIVNMLSYDNGKPF